MIQSPYRQKDSQKLERVQKLFFSYVNRVLKITLPPHDFTLISKYLNLPNLDTRRKMLHTKFIINLVHGSIDTTRLLSKVSFHVPRLESRHNRMFEINTRKTDYLCNDPIQRMMRLINLDTSLLHF